MQRVPGHVVALGVLVAVVAAVAWWGGIAVGSAAAPDAPEHIEYARYLANTGHLPPKSLNYEYTSPPGYAFSVVYLQRWARWLHIHDGAPLFVLPANARRIGWLALLALAGLALTSRSLPPRARVGAACAVGILVLAGFVAVVARMRQVPWSTGQMISLVSACILVLVTAALARRALPGSRYAPVIAAGAVAALPVFMREAVVFHPEALFAALVALALYAFVRGVEGEWRLRYAVAVGALVGLAALTRQTAPVVAVALGVAAVVAGRRDALRFVGVAAVALALVAGPWWGYQASRFGNPIQSNLDRPPYMLPNGQPRAFYLSFPAHDLVLHPYRNAFKNQLLPKFHADLWSDWYGVDRNFWATPSRAERVLASSQSLLGFGGDAVILAGLIVLGLPALGRLGHSRETSPLLGTLALLSLLTWVTFVITLVRFPQASGDPIKASYFLFLAPAAAIFAVAFGRWLWRRGRGWRIAVSAWALLYAASYAGVLFVTYF